MLQTDTKATLLALLDAAATDDTARLILADCLEEMGADDLADMARNVPYGHVVHQVRRLCLERGILSWADLPEYESAAHLRQVLYLADWNSLPEHDGRLSLARLYALARKVLEQVGALRHLNVYQSGRRVCVTITPTFPSIAARLDCREMVERLLACVFPDRADAFCVS